MTKTLVSEALRLAADQVTDLETLWISSNNRTSVATRDPEKGGHGLPADEPLVITMSAITDALKDQLDVAVKQLEKIVTKSPFGAWLKDPVSKGVGAKTLARLLGTIGDPYLIESLVRDEEGEVTGTILTPRTVSMLWSYAGYGTDKTSGQARRPIKGMSQAEVFLLGKPEAKKRAWLIADSTLKSGIRRLDPTLKEDPEGPYNLENRAPNSRYGEVYLDRRKATLERLHSADCVRCGPSGRPALAGSPWSGAHQHADAVRVVAKEVLKDLWIIGRDFHAADFPNGQPVAGANVALMAQASIREQARKAAA